MLFTTETVPNLLLLKVLRCMQAALALHGLKFDGRPVAASFVEEDIFEKLYDAILKEDAAVNGLTSSAAS